MLSTLKNTFSESNLKNTLKKYYKKDIRVNKLTCNDILAYKLLYTSTNSTKQMASKSVNNDTKKDVVCNAYYEQSKKYTLPFYDTILKQLTMSYNKFTDAPKSIDYVIKNRLNNAFIDDDFTESVLGEYVILLVDGSCNNSYKNHKLHTDNTIFIYDYMHSTCIDTYTKRKLYAPTKKHKTETLTKTGKKRAKYKQSNKNNEVNMFMDYIKTHHKQLQKMYENKTIIFVCDRAYHCYKLFYLLDEYNFKYIIRIKDNTLLNSDKNTKSKDVLYFRKNTRCITYDISLQFEYVDLDKKKKKCNILTKYNIITNLNNKQLFTDLLIKKIYHIRWNIEIYFKFAKKNTKLAFFREKNPNSHKIMRTCISIVNILVKYLIHIYIKSQTFKEKRKYKNFLNTKCVQKINYSLLINGLYTKFLTQLVKNKYKRNDLLNFVNCFFDTYTNKTNRSFPRTSLIPFSKWYVKKYHNIYDMNAILIAIKNDTVDELHKNLKTKAKKFIGKIKFDV